MKKTTLFLLLFALMGSVAVAQLPGSGEKKEKKSDLSAQVPLDKKVRYGKLDNGFTYYVRNNKKPEKMIQFRLVTNAGSIMERDDQQGLAHFCEHMAFNGIKGYPHNEMIDKLQKNGVEFGRDINAYTSFDQTVYYVNMPANDEEMVKMGIEILDGWAGNVLFDEKEIEEERGVIHEEWRGGVGHGDGRRRLVARRQHDPQGGTRKESCQRCGPVSPVDYACKSRHDSRLRMEQNPVCLYPFRGGLQGDAFSVWAID